MSVIEIEGLTRDYGRGRGVFDLTFSIEAGEVFGFLGPNGAGKTTAIRHLMGFIRAKAGSCRIGGLDCWKNAPAIQRNLGYIPGETAFPEDMTGEGFLRFTGAYRGTGLSRMKELMDRFELDGRGRIRRMSKGMKQKVAIVAAFMHDPAVLVLDEPTNGLDPLMQNRFVELILEEKQRGKTVLMSSHMFEEVEKTCDRVAILKEGRLAVVSDRASLAAEKQKRYLVTLASAEEAAAFAEEPLAVTDRAGTTVTVAVRQEGMAAFTAALHRHEVTDIAVRGQNLEEIFMHYYGGESQ